MGVRTHPGHTVLTCAPREPKSRAMDLASPIRPCLALTQPTDSGVAARPAIGGNDHHAAAPRDELWQAGPRRTRQVATSARLLCSQAS
jgi:hypothetical protein